MPMTRHPACRLACALAGALAGLPLTGCATADRFSMERLQPGEAMAAPATDNPGLQGPRLIIPPTGGPPLMAMPLGGGVYAPLNGDPVTPGTPIGP